MHGSNSLVICLPWNANSYVPLNAFHPLYKFLLTRSSALPTTELPELIFRKLDRDHWKHYLTQCPDDRKKILASLKLPQAINLEANSKPAKDFWGFFDPIETAADEVSDYDIKIAHTSPISIGLKPFIFHLEDFFTLFYPWAISLQDFKKISKPDFNEIRKFLEQILGSDKCLAIVSHAATTVEELKKFFDSSNISKKIFFSPLGIAAPNEPIEKLTASKKRRFLFGGSLHGNQQNLAGRGLAIFCDFIKIWSQLHPEDEYIFMGQQPSLNPTFNKAHTSSSIEEIVGYKNVLFLGRDYLDDEIHSKILSKIDYTFLISSRLHSVSLLKSMAYSATPIVLNLPEILSYGINENNALIIEAFDDIKIFNSNIKKHYACESKIEKIQTLIVTKLAKKLNSIINTEEEQELKRNGYQLLKEKFQPKVAYQELAQIIHQQYANYSSQNLAKKTPDPLLGYEGLANYNLPALMPILESDFNQRPTSLISVNLGFGTILTNGRESFYLDCSNLNETRAILNFNIDFRPYFNGKRMPANLSYDTAFHDLSRALAITIRKGRIALIKSQLRYAASLIKRFLKNPMRGMKKILEILKPKLKLHNRQHFTNKIPF